MPKLAYKKYELILTDIVLFNLALLLSFFIRFDVSWSMYSKYMHYSYFIIITIISITVLHYSGLYNKMWQYASIGEVVSVLKSSFYINLGLVLFIFLSQRAFPRSVIFINFLLNIFVLGASRFGFRFFTDFLNSQDIDGERTKVLIIGAGDAGEIIIREMQKHPELKKEVIGLIDDNPHKHNLEIHGVKVMGTRKNIPEIVESYAVDEIIIAIPSAHGKDIKQIYEYCNETDAK
ncbi:MAG: nucleoside-diphosphate sugar epimerase/dehydratase, partial [bacterium]